MVGGPYSVKLLELRKGVVLAETKKQLKVLLMLFKA
jgi:hypothetical protein